MFRLVFFVSKNQIIICMFFFFKANFRWWYRSCRTYWNARLQQCKEINYLCKSISSSDDLITLFDVCAGVSMYFYQFNTDQLKGDKGTFCHDIHLTKIIQNENLISNNRTPRCRTLILNLFIWLEWYVFSHRWRNKAQGLLN